MAGARGSGVVAVCRFIVIRMAERGSLHTLCSLAGLIAAQRAHTLSP
jgi:hypothetical protein